MFDFEDVIKQMPVLFQQLASMEAVDRTQVRKLPGKGVYVFYEDSKPIYVGRSKTIPDRILSHSRPSSGHNSATFAFLLAKEEAERLKYDTNRTRSVLEQDQAFKQIYLEQKARVSRMKIKAVGIDSPEVEAIFEIYVSKKLNTKYNDWITH
jgi:hypothetical protein